jgi:hypothetical protein
MEKDIKEAEDSIKGAHAQIAKLHKDMAALNTKLAKHEVQFSPNPASWQILLMRHRRTTQGQSTSSRRNGQR